MMPLPFHRDGRQLGRVVDGLRGIQPSGYKKSGILLAFVKGKCLNCVSPEVPLALCKNSVI